MNSEEGFIPECVICHELTDEPLMLETGITKHCCALVIHRTCVLRTFRATKKTECPVCRGAFALIALFPKLWIIQRDQTIETRGYDTEKKYFEHVFRYLIEHGNPSNTEDSEWVFALWLYVQKKTNEIGITPLIRHRIASWFPLYGPFELNAVHPHTGRTYFSDAVRSEDYDRVQMLMKLPDLKPNDTYLSSKKTIFSVALKHGMIRTKEDVEWYLNRVENTQFGCMIQNKNIPYAILEAIIIHSNNKVWWPEVTVCEILDNYEYDHFTLFRIFCIILARLPSIRSRACEYADQTMTPSQYLKKLDYEDALIVLKYTRPRKDLISIQRYGVWFKISQEQLEQQTRFVLNVHGIDADAWMASVRPNKREREETIEE